MATPKTNAVPPTEAPRYIVFDSTVPTISSGDNQLTRSLPKVTQQLLKTAINDLKGVMFSYCRTRVWYYPEGYNGNPNDRLYLEFTSLYSLGMGKATAELVALAGHREGEGA